MLKQRLNTFYTIQLKVTEDEFKIKNIVLAKSLYNENNLADELQIPLNSEFKRENGVELIARVNNYPSEHLLICSYFINYKILNNFFIELSSNVDKLYSISIYNN